VQAAEPPSGTGAPLALKREPEVNPAEQNIQPENSSITASPKTTPELENPADLEHQIDFHDSLGGHEHTIHSGVF
jgi:hypothetical protein